jgi:radical SAM superfamily enzyme YgiQ (UPF0313 family)
VTLVNIRTSGTMKSLREPGAILLVSCYELGHQPIGIAQPLGFLLQAGYAPAGLDIAVEDFDEERVRRARVVGISVPMHTALRLGVRMADLIRSVNPACHICFFGLYASLNAEYLLQQAADSVIGGEFEMPLVHLIEALENGGADSIEGVSRRGHLVDPFLKRMGTAAFPVPERRALPALNRYARLERDGERHVAGYVEASRGCLHRCLHCPIVPVYDGRFFVFPESAVLEDIRRQVQDGATHITFGDPDFLNGPGHSLSIVRAMHAEFPHVTFDYTAKIEHLLKHQGLLRELKALGCLFVISAVESFSDTVLARLEKGHTRADALAVAALFRQAGLTLRPSLVPFTPWTTLDEYVELFEIVASHDLVDAVDPVQYTIRLLIPPGSALLQHADLRDCLGPLDQASFQYQWSHADARMDQLHRDASALVEEAAQSGEHPDVTFDRLRALAYAAAGRILDAKQTHSHPQGQGRAPRLTESWFCCAEPTTGQFRPLHTKGRSEI